MTVAPTRAGKGVGTVIPNLLMVPRSVLLIDPKGENSKIAGEARKRFGAVHILDPFGVTGRPSSAYNPLGRLSGLIMFVMAHENSDRKTLATVREYLTLPPARSDFQFSALRHDVTSVFLVLPPNRLDAYSRWLRLLVAQGPQ